ncbi:cadherin repeat domain-containing protein [Carboxylicivirga marina]|uniref:Uncharacterized protein n=1 Tax=Carboxylicivirga marina TaxID=2800988 RepID=A0ABS1HGW4_9BACT|nr:hypothetical protein [Carboxylicivirga marina]MBK3516866.1 hypothetical protein [Carboxylicivirga marina]
MKSLLKIPFAFIVCTTFLMGCDDDEKAGTPPTADNVTTEILAEPGDEIVFEGTFNAEDGFSKITLSNDEIMLDKQIVFANHVTQYFLDYKFTLPEEAALKVYDITISAEALGGATETYSTKVDVATPPSVDISVDFVALPGEDIVFEGTITDDQGLTEIKLINAGIGLDHIIELAGNPTSYDLSYTYTIPVASEMKMHNGTVEVTNLANRATTLPMKVNLSGEDIVYENIYIAGGFQWWTWNPELAYPMDKDPNDDKWFEVPVNCWDGFDELKFLGQLGWNPDNWGLVDQADPSKGMLNDDSSAAILLGANGANPAYKKVRFNPYIMQYSVEDITDVVTPKTEMYIVGSGFPGYPALNWNTEEAIPMTANPYGYGEHIFLIEGLEFSDDVSIKFIGQTDGWGPYDAGFDVGEQEVTAPVSWVKIKEGDGSKDLKFKNQAGTYTVLFDYYLKRALIWQE